MYLPYVNGLLHSIGEVRLSVPISKILICSFLGILSEVGKELKIQIHIRLDYIWS